MNPNPAMGFSVDLTPQLRVQANKPLDTVKHVTTASGGTIYFAWFKDGSLFAYNEKTGEHQIKCRGEGFLRIRFPGGAEFLGEQYPGSGHLSQLIKEVRVSGGRDAAITKLGDDVSFLASLRNREPPTGIMRKPNSLYFVIPTSEDSTDHKVVRVLENDDGIFVIREHCSHFDVYKVDSSGRFEGRVGLPSGGLDRSAEEASAILREMKLRPDCEVSYETYLSSFPKE